MLMLRKTNLAANELIVGPSPAGYFNVNVNDAIVTANGRLGLDVMQMGRNQDKLLFLLFY